MKSTTSSGEGSGGGGKKKGPKNTKKPRDPRTPGGRLDAFVETTGLGTKFGQKLKPPASYQAVNKWTKDINFGPENQARVTEAFGLPSDYFSGPDAAKAREAARELAWQAFCNSDDGRFVTEEQRGMLGGMLRHMTENVEVNQTLLEDLWMAVKRGQRKGTANSPPAAPTPAGSGGSERQVKSRKHRGVKLSDS